jgi:hypothetical protein
MALPIHPGCQRARPVLGAKRKELPEDCRPAYEAGATIEELSVKHGVSSMTMRMHLLRLGTEMRPAGVPPGKYLLSVPPDFVERFNAPMTIGNLCLHYDVTYGVVQRWMKEADLHRTRGEARHIAAARERAGRQETAAGDEEVKLVGHFLRFSWDREVDHHLDDKQAALDAIIADETARGGSGFPPIGAR